MRIAWRVCSARRKFSLPLITPTWLRSTGSSAARGALRSSWSLSRRHARRAFAQGPLPSSEAINVAMQIAAALEAAHERGIVHRDLKPANIKLKGEGTVKVLDFGLAKALDRVRLAGCNRRLTAPAMSEAGVVLGTAAYMSPEQARGKPVDRRADIWAFGCVLTRCSPASRHFRRRHDEHARAHSRARPRHAALPFQRIAGRAADARLCLEKDPRKRLPAHRRRQAHARRPFGNGGASAVALAARGDRGSAGRRRAAARRLSRESSNQTGTRRFGGADRGTDSEFLRTRLPAGQSIASQSGVDLAISQDGKRIAFYTQRVGALLRA